MFHSIIISPSAGQNPLQVALSNWLTLNKSIICNKHKSLGESHLKKLAIEIGVFKSL